MKKLLFLAATTALALSSCSDNEITSMVQTGKTPVKIDVYSQGQTRVTETVLQTLQNNGFKLQVTNSDGGVELDATATYATATGWSYGSNIYWPYDETKPLTFCAIYPESEIADGNTQIELDGATDVVAAYTSTTMPTGGQVSLSFGHILSQLAIYARGNNDDFTYSVTQVEVMAPAEMVYSFESGVAEYLDDAPVDYLTSATGVSAPYSTTTYTDLNTAHAIVAAKEVEISVSYTVTKKSDTTDTQNYTKSARVVTQKGMKHNVNLTLPCDRTPVTITVSVNPWENAADTDKTVS